MSDERHVLGEGYPKPKDGWSIGIKAVALTTRDGSVMPLEWPTILKGRYRMILEKVEDIK